MIAFDGEFEMEQSREALWAYFTDPDVLADCAPGLEEMSLESPSEVTAVMSVGVGSVKPTFDVDVTVTRAEYPEMLEMTAEGSESRNAFETVASLRLSEADGGGTRAEWTATADVSGRIASMGGRALGSVTKRLVSGFFEDVEAAARDGREATSRMAAAEDAEASLDGE